MASSPISLHATSHLLLAMGNNAKNKSAKQLAERRPTTNRKLHPHACPTGEKPTEKPKPCFANHASGGDLMGQKDAKGQKTLIVCSFFAKHDQLNE